MAEVESEIGREITKNSKTRNNRYSISYIVSIVYFSAVLYEIISFLWIQIAWAREGNLKIMNNRGTVKRKKKEIRCKAACSYIMAPPGSTVGTLMGPFRLTTVEDNNSFQLAVNDADSAMSIDVHLNGRQEEGCAVVNPSRDLSTRSEERSSETNKRCS